MKPKAEQSIWAALLRGVLHTIVRFYYPRIEVSGEGEVPRTGPVLLVANHPNSLLDPLLLGIVAKRPVRLLAKAPLFQITGLGPIMRIMGMIPAHRGSDSRSRAEVTKNLESLRQAAQSLGDGEGAVMGIFPEGKSHDDLQVAMVRSGAARLAMQAVAGGVKDLRIVPVGLNYERKDRFRSAVWINVGEAIDAAAWLAQHGGEERVAMRALTPEIDRRMKSVAIHLEDAKWEPLLEEVEGLLPAARGLHRVGLLQLRQRVAEAINHFHATDSARARAAAEKVETWAERRRASGLPADARFFRQPMAVRVLALVWDVVKLVGVLVLAVMGLVHHLIPHGVTRFFAARFDQAGKMTVALNRLLVGLVVHTSWAVLVGWVMLQVFQPWVVWGWLAMLPWSGFAAVWIFRRLRLVVPNWWAELRLLPQRKRTTALREERTALVAMLQEMATEYAGAPEPALSARRLVRPPLWVGLGMAGAVGLLVAILGGWLLRDRPLEILHTDAPALHRLTEGRLNAQLGESERGLTAVIDGLSELETRFRKFEQELLAGDRSYYRPEDDDEMRRMLVTFLSLRSALLRDVWRYQRFAQITDERLRLRALLVHYTAAAVLYDYSARFVLAFEESEEAQRKLNEGEPRWGLEPGIYDRIRANLGNIAHRQWLVDGWTHYHATLPQWRESGMGPESSEPWGNFHHTIAAVGERTAELGERILGYKIATATADVLTTLGEGYYRASSTLSTLVGDAKIRAPRGGASLITPELLDRLRPLLQPGDILIERRNWYLSNAFLPGYWPHAALYVGSADDLAAMGIADDPAVAKWAQKFTTPDEQGHELRVIEAVSEGVVFTSLEHSVGEADAVAVLRPKLSAAEKRQVIANAFSHAGKPYDFDFDFFSSDKLVCTEVVYRSFGERLDVPLVEIMGRQTLPAINIVQAWATGDQLEFVALLDGNERTGKCEWADEETLRESLDRPALTVLNP